MWKWILGSWRYGHGHAPGRDLGSPRALRRFLGELEAARADEALAAVASVFESEAALRVAPAARLHALCTLDEHAARGRRALSARLIEDSPKQLVSRSVSDALLQHYRALENGYRLALEALPVPAHDSHAHSLATLAACRALHALAKQNMLLRMSYREPAPDTWRRIESHFCALPARTPANATLALYPDDPAETGLTREYLVSLLFEVAPTANLLPAQIHALDLLLRRHAAGLRLSDRFDRQAAPFVIDPVRETRPARWLPGLQPRTGMRFFGLGEAYRLILDERGRAAGQPVAPEWLGCTQLSAARYRELLDALAQQFALAPPARAQRREPIAGEILVAREFGLVRRLIHFNELAQSGRSLDYDRFSAYAVTGMVRGHLDVQLHAPDEQQAVSAEDALRNLESFESSLEAAAIEVWRVNDTSEDGIGAEAPGPALTIKAGMLAAYRHPQCALWQLAVLRRVTTGSDGRLRVGMRKLAGTPQVARIALDDTRQPKTRTSAAAPAAGPTLHYDAIRLAAAEPSLVLPPGVFDPAWRYLLTVGKRWDFIRMQRCAECGLDFEQVAFDIVKAQQAA